MGRFLGSGTEACVWPVPTVGALTGPVIPVMVSPTCICPLVSPAKTMDEGSRQRMKANLHIFLLPARDQPSDFATVMCEDGTVPPSIRQGCRGSAREQQIRGQRGLRIDAWGGRKELTKSGRGAGSTKATAISSVHCLDEPNGAWSYHSIA